MEEKQSVDRSIRQTEKKPDKSKRPEKFHMMLFVDSKKGLIHQIGISQKLIECFALILLVLLFVLIAGWSISAKSVSRLSLDNRIMEEQEKVYKDKISELETLNSELENKITVLSDTVNAKVEKENANLEEDMKAHMPNGFPLSSGATMEVSEDNANTIILTASGDANVIATGAGVVYEIVTDSDYQCKLTIDHENGYQSVFYNNGTPMVKEGDAVIAGSVLFVTGEDNAALAYQILQDGKEIDPIDMIEIDG